MDVNDPENCRLLRYINLPSQWTTRAGSGFDTFIIEGYQYPGSTTTSTRRPAARSTPWKELAWDQAHCRYLMGLYYGTWPWLREFVNVNRLGLPAIKIWAYDRPLPHSAGRSRCRTTDDRSFIYANGYGKPPTPPRRGGTDRRAPRARNRHAPPN
jgi:hypothetical protein